MRAITIILLVVTLFPITGPLLLFYSMAGIAIGAGMLVEGESIVFGLVSLSVCSAALYAVAQLFSLAKHFIKEPHANPEPSKLKHNVYGLMVGYACYLVLPLLLGQYGVYPLFLGAPALLLAISFHLAIWRIGRSSARARIAGETFERNLRRDAGRRRTW